MTPPPGRNDPCPCGSGRKFKHCCLRAFDAEDATRARLRAAEGRVVPALIHYAGAEWGEDFFAEAWEEFFGWNAVPDHIEDSREFGTTFDPFFVFSFVPDPAEGLPDDWPAEPVALDYLRHVDSCPDLDREFIDEACKSQASFFVVRSVTPGRALEIKDILTGRQFRVLEQSASRTFKPGDLTFTRVVTVGGTSIMIGAAPWVIPPSWHVPVIEFRERARPRGFMTCGDLFEYDIEIRDLYHGIVDSIQHPPLPQLQNTDGDPIEMTTMTYALGLCAAEAIERLLPLAMLGQDEDVEEEGRDESGALTSATITWIKAGNRQHKDWDNTVLGRLRVEGARLVVDVNSARRRDKIGREIAKRLGAKATLVGTKVTDVGAEVRRRATAGTGPAGPVVSMPHEIERTPEFVALEAELGKKHWDAWVDTKIPALGNKTPRQAATTERGRERLEALFADFARRDERRPSAFGADVAELRRKIGMA